jgi:nitrate/nitrite transport system substrate-binding protein
LDFIEPLSAAHFAAGILIAFIGLATGQWILHDHPSTSRLSMHPRVQLNGSAGCSHSVSKLVGSSAHSTGYLEVFRGGWLLRFVGVSLLLTASGCGGQRISMEDLERAAEHVLRDLPQCRAESSTDQVERIVEIEKPHLKFGFIKLTDCAPLVIALEKGFFSEEGLHVQLEAQSNWKVLLDRVIDGQLDGAHMLAGQPIGATIGIGTRADVITACSLDYNGNAITVSNTLWKQMQAAAPRLSSPQPPRPITAEPLRGIVQARKDAGNPLTMGMVFPVSTHNYELRYWLAAAGIHPGMYTEQDVAGTTDADVLLSVTPPPQMPSTLEAGTIDGYCVGEPWNQKAVTSGIGIPVITNAEIWKNNPEKVFGVTKEWDRKHRQTHIAVIKSLIRAGKWLDATDEAGAFINRAETASILSRPEYVGAEYQVIASSITGTFMFQNSDVRPMPDFNVFFKDYANYPHYSDCIWFLTQMRRWGQITDAKPAQWYADTAASIYHPEIYRQAANALIAEGHLDATEVPPPDYNGYRPVTDEFVDSRTFDAMDPIGYLRSFEIGMKD